MALCTQEHTSKGGDWDDEEFSDEQIKALLQRAEQRLSNSEHSRKTIVGAKMSQKYAPKPDTLYAYC